MPDLDIAGIVGGGLSGYLTGSAQKADIDLRRQQFEQEKEQDRIAQERADEMQNWAREKHKIEIPRMQAESTYWFYKAAEAKSEDEKATAMRGYLKAQGLDPGMIAGMAAINDLEFSKERIKTERAQQGSAAASAEAARANAAESRARTEGVGIENELRRFNLDTSKQDRDITLLKQADDLGFQVSPKVVSERTGIPQSEITMRPKAGATDPVKIAFDRAKDALELFRNDGGKSPQMHETAKALVNDYMGIVHMLNGGSKENFQPVEKLDVQKPLDLQAWTDLYVKANPTGMLGGREPDPRLADVSTLSLDNINRLTGVGQSTTAPEIPPYVTTWATTPERQKDIADFVKANGRFPSEKELAAAGGEPAQAAAPAGPGVFDQLKSLIGGGADWLTSGAEKNQKKK